MSRIFVSIEFAYDSYWVDLITESHRRNCPNDLHDWQVAPLQSKDGIHHILSGGDKWLRLGCNESAIDLPNNLAAGMVAYEISRDYDRFLASPAQWLKELATSKHLKDVDLVFEEKT